MNKPGGGGTVKTSADASLTTPQRNVTIGFEKVEVHSDSEASCGDFLFVFELSAPSKINGAFTATARSRSATARSGTRMTSEFH